MKSICISLWKYNVITIRVLLCRMIPAVYSCTQKCWQLACFSRRDGPEVQTSQSSIPPWLGAPHIAHTTDQPQPHTYYGIHHHAITTTEEDQQLAQQAATLYTTLNLRWAGYRGRKSPNTTTTAAVVNRYVSSRCSPWEESNERKQFASGRCTWGLLLVQTNKNKRIHLLKNILYIHRATHRSCFAACCILPSFVARRIISKTRIIQYTHLSCFVHSHLAGIFTNYVYTYFEV